MSSILGKAEFVEADITFNESREYPYLFNLVAFDDTTLEWTIVSRVRMDKEGAKAHALAFRKSFQKCEEDFPTFQPGVSLTGVVTDWSDAEILGLGQAVGKETAKTLLKGCKVHWARSWQRVRDQVARSSDKPRERAIFSKIASQIPKIEGQRVAYCFQALCSESPSVQDLVGIVDGLTVEDAKFVASECNWMTAKHWAKWWMRQEHLQMLHKDFTHMVDDVWSRCPADTNAVERKKQGLEGLNPSVHST